MAAPERAAANMARAWASPCSSSSNAGAETEASSSATTSYPAGTAWPETKASCGVDIEVLEVVCLHLVCLIVEPVIVLHVLALVRGRKTLSEPPKTTVGENADRARFPVHDLGHLGHAEIADDPQRYCFGLIRGQGSDHGQSIAVEKRDDEGRHINGVGCVRKLEGSHLRPAGLAADPVQTAVAGDGEQPTAETTFVALEARQAARPLQPRFRSEVLGLSYPTTTRR